MAYMLSTKVNTYDNIKFDRENSSDESWFREGVKLSGNHIDLNFSIKNKKAVQLIRQCDFVKSLGPHLVSRKFRDIIERYTENQVEFFDVKISSPLGLVDGFYAINIIFIDACCDMGASEYILSNFDPSNPLYSFFYTVVADDIPSGMDIVRCIEQPVKIVISDRLKNICLREGLSGVVFCKSIDMTYQNRSICESL